MARRNKRSKAQPFAVFSSESETTCKVIDRVDLNEGLERERLGLVERNYDTYSGELIGFRLKARKQDDTHLKSHPSPAAITGPSRKRPNDPKRVCEMEVFAFAGTTFEDANSHTAGRREVDRLSLELSGREPEDRIERTVAKVLVWRQVGGKRRDVLRVWPKGVSLKSLGHI